MSRVLLIVALLAMVAAFATGIAVAATTTSPGTSADTINIAGPPTSTSTMAATWTTTPFRNFGCPLAEVGTLPVARSGTQLVAVVETINPNLAAGIATSTAEISQTLEAVARSTSYVLGGTGTNALTSLRTKGPDEEELPPYNPKAVAATANGSAISVTGATANSSTTWAATGKIEYDAYKMTYRAPVNRLAQREQRLKA